MAAKKAKAGSPEKKSTRAKVTTEFTPIKFKDHTIKQKSTGRFEVLTSTGKNLNGAEKVKILIDAKVLKGSFKKSPAAETAAN